MWPKSIKRIIPTQKQHTATLYNLSSTGIKPTSCSLWTKAHSNPPVSPQNVFLITSPSINYSVNGNIDLALNISLRLMSSMCFQTLLSLQNKRIFASLALLQITQITTDDRKVNHKLTLFILLWVLHSDWKLWHCRSQNEAFAIFKAHRFKQITCNISTPTTLHSKLHMLRNDN